MRLIDKDFILKTAKDKEWGLWCEIVNIKFAPEVDAIPVEWLKKKCDEADNMGMGIDDWSVKDCYQLVLEQWYKENEQNRKNTSQTD